MQMLAAFASISVVPHADGDAKAAHSTANAAEAVAPPDDSAAQHEVQLNMGLPPAVRERINFDGAVDAAQRPTHTA